MLQSNNITIFHYICKEIENKDNKNYIYQSIADKVLMIFLNEKYSFIDSGFENDDNNDQFMNIFYPILFFLSKIFWQQKNTNQFFYFFYSSLWKIENSNFI